jgi:hypothetical protein
MSDDQRDWAREVFGNHDRRSEALERASIESANLALKGLLLLNGGACIAILGFLASIFSSDVQKNEIQALLSPFLVALNRFAWGAGLAVFASAIAYLANSSYARGNMAFTKKWEWPYVEENNSSKRNWRLAAVLNGVAIASGFWALGMFVWGCVAVGVAY